MEQVQYDLLYRGLIGLTMDDAAVALFNKILAQAETEGLLSGEHFSVDGTLTQAWANHKSFAHKNADDDADGSDFKDQTRSNDTHRCQCTALSQGQHR